MKGWLELMQVILCAFSLLLCANTAHAASFDCAKAQTRVEKAICHDPEISRLDGELGKVYAAVLARVDSEQEKRLVSQELNWLKNVRDVCPTQTCLSRAYQTRLAALRTIYDKSAAPRSAAGKDRGEGVHPAFLGKYVAYPALNYLLKAIPVAPVVRTLVSNFNQFRTVPFSSPNPRLSPRFPQFYRPHWTQIPLNLKLAKAIVTEWVTGGQAHVAHCHLVPRCRSVWEDWLKTTRVLREKGAPVMWRTRLDLLGDGQHETIIRLRMPPDKHAGQTRSDLQPSFSQYRPFMDSELYMLPASHPQMARWFNGDMGAGWTTWPTDIIGNKDDSEHPYYELTWNPSAALVHFTYKTGIGGTIGVTTFAKNAPGHMRSYHYVPLGNIAWIQSVHVAPGPHQWPQVLYQTPRLAAYCAQALKVARAQFQSDHFYLNGPPPIPPGLGSTFALGPDPGDISGGEGIQYNHRFFRKLTPPPHDTRVNANTFVYWQKTASPGRRVVVVDEPMNWQGDWYGLFTVPVNMQPKRFWHQIGQLESGTDKTEAGVRQVIGLGWRPPVVFSDNRTDRLWAINLNQERAWYPYTIGPKVATSECTILLQPRPPYLGRSGHVYLLPLLPPAVHQLARTLNVILGQDENSGTLHPVASLRTAAGKTWVNVALRPWALTNEPYNTMAEVNAGLRAWAKSTPSHHRLYDELMVEYPEARRALAHYYRSRFHKSDKAASELATRALNIAFRSYFVFQRGSAS